MNLASENEMHNVNVNIAKAYSSGGGIDCRLNYGNPYTTTKYAKFLGNVNTLTLMGNDRTEALIRRQIFIPFTKNIKNDVNIKLDINIHHKILNNKAGILNWILEGMNEVFKNEKIYQSDQVQVLLHHYAEDTNPIKQMIKEKGFRIININENIPKKDYMTLTQLYNFYKDFVIEIGAGKQSRANFKKDLLGIKNIREANYNNIICFNLTIKIIKI